MLKGGKGIRREREERRKEGRGRERTGWDGDKFATLDFRVAREVRFEPRCEEGENEPCG